jgi:branched-chain amino acid transport system permease protein
MLNRRVVLVSVLLLAIIIALLCVPLITTDTYYQYIITMVFLNSILALSLRLIMSVGEVSFAHAAFMAIGAYASATLVTRTGLNVWAAFPVAALVAAALAVVIGIPALRVKGVYFFLVTFAFGQVVILLIKGWSFFGSTQGIFDIPKPGGITTTADFYFLAFGLLLLTLIVMYLLEKSRFGVALKAIKGSDKLAESVGISVIKHKVAAFSIACFFAGLAGAFYAHFIQQVGPYVFDFSRSMQILMFTVVGGQGYILGPIVGAGALGTLQEVFKQFQVYSLIAFGALLVVFMLFLPGGITSIPGRIKSFVDKRSRSKEQPIR